MKRMAHFKHWFGLGALLLAALGFAWLGRWQLDRAATHRAVAEQFAAGAGLGVVTTVPASEDQTERLRYRRLKLTGHYEAEVQILLDNMTESGQAGYQVLTPFDAGGDRLVLVNRGWVAAAPDRQRLPDLALPFRAAAPSGRIDRLPRAALSLSAPPVAAGAPLLVMSFPDFAAIESALGRAVYPFQLLLDAEAPAGFGRNWGPDPSRADRSIAYAVQWFGLAGLAVVLGLGVAWRSRSGGGAR
jgi:surfeit locus 1 family protein